MEWIRNQEKIKKNR